MFILFSGFVAMDPWRHGNADGGIWMGAEFLESRSDRLVAGEFSDRTRDPDYERIAELATQTCQRIDANDTDAFPVQRRGRQKRRDGLMCARNRPISPGIVR